MYLLRLNGLVMWIRGVAVIARRGWARYHEHWNDTSIVARQATRPVGSAQVSGLANAP
jgi:hypothetical protein